MTDSELMKAYRNRNGLTQKEASEALGWSGKNAVISQIENGHRPLSGRARKLIEVLLNVKR